MSERAPEDGDDFDDGDAFDDGASPDSSAPHAADGDAREGLHGPRLVGILYAALVAVAGVSGVLVGVFVDGLRAPRFLFVVPFPPTPLGFAAYGALTVAIVLGIPLALVVYVSRNLDEETA